MTQQFKFGDRVRNEEGNEFVYLRGYLSSCTLATEDGSLYRCSGKHVTLIPHPDTVRLDWLEKNHAILYHNTAEDIKHGCAPIEVGCLYEEKPHGGCTVREAIDTAMREKDA